MTWQRFTVGPRKTSGMRPQCAYPGCNRLTPRWPSHLSGNGDSFCTRHDGRTDHGDICHCDSPQPDHLGECAQCRHLVLETIT
jgi:hypothetical protein